MQSRTIAATLLVSAAALGSAQSISKPEPWGEVDGQKVWQATLDNGHGLKVTVSNYGAILTKIETKDMEGNWGDVALGFNDLKDYQEKSPYFGTIVGRYGNRIAKGEFTLSGKTYHLFLNNEPVPGKKCSLHGGKVGFDKHVYNAKLLPGKEPGIRLFLESPDGDEGYPGTLKLTVTYRVLRNNTLDIVYDASTDKATPLNVTNHTYFNLKGEGNGDVLGHELMVNATRMTPTDDGQIPTGKITSVKGTPFDFRHFHPLGERIDADDQQIKFGSGYDHNFVLSGSGMELAAKVKEPTTGRTLEVWTDQPGVQLYTGNFLDGSLTGKSGKSYGRRSAFCLETQHFPDSPNHKNFPSTIVRPGHAYHSETQFRFGVTK